MKAIVSVIVLAFSLPSFAAPIMQEVVSGQLCVSKPNVSKLSLIESLQQTIDLNPKFVVLYSETTTRNFTIEFSGMVIVNKPVQLEDFVVVGSTACVKVVSKK